MNDPFAMLNPIDKPKTAPAYGGLPPAPVAPLHPIGGGGGFGGPSGMGMGMGGMPGGMGMGMGGGMPGGMGISMGGGMPGNMGMGAGMPGGMGMNMGGGMGQGMVHGIAPGMAPGTGMGMNMGGGMPQQQQQAPIMYDNIKNLLEQKPKPSGSMRDDAGMDFLENLGSGKANNLSVSSPTAAASSPFGSAGDPFGGPVSAPVAAPTVSLAGFAFPGESATSTAAPTAVSPSNGAKSSALADRLANGRRKTQEAQRQQLGINAGAFSPSSGAPKISLKEMAPQSSSPASSATSGDRAGRTPSLEDFASGKPVFQESDPFGMSSGSSSGSSNRTTSGSSHTQPKTSSSSLAYSSSSGSAFDNDGGSLFADSDADFEKKLNGGNPGTGSARQLSSGNLGTANRTGSGGAAAKATMDFGW